jgi:hypothetical protein
MTQPIEGKRNEWVEATETHETTLEDLERVAAAMREAVRRGVLAADALHAALAPQEGGLDAAWAEAEAALREAPLGGRVEYVEWTGPGYRAAGTRAQEWLYGEGPTPEAALRALTARLRPRGMTAAEAAERLHALGTLGVSVDDFLASSDPEP